MVDVVVLGTIVLDDIETLRKVKEALAEAALTQHMQHHSSQSRALSHCRRRPAEEAHRYAEKEGYIC